MSLYYAFRLAQANGGNLSCESAIGKGTVFRITLPASGRTIKLFPVAEEKCTVSKQADVGGR
jgi:hypothetical protein